MSGNTREGGASQRDVGSRSREARREKHRRRHACVCESRDPKAPGMFDRVPRFLLNTMVLCRNPPTTSSGENHAGWVPFTFFSETSRLRSPTHPLSCAGLDLGLLITAVLAALPAGASARGCDYDCFWLLCFPCAPVGGEGMAAVLVLTALGLAFAAGFKMWIMAPALLSGSNSEQNFLPW